VLKKTWRAIRLDFSFGGMNQGFVHVIGPHSLNGSARMTHACGDSHTASHGALWQIGYRHRHESRCRDVLRVIDSRWTSSKCAHHITEGLGTVRCQRCDSSYHPPPRGRRGKGLRVRIRRSNHRSMNMEEQHAPSVI
jgi:hypothetical protein